VESNLTNRVSKDIIDTTQWRVLLDTSFPVLVTENAAVEVRQIRDRKEEVCYSDARDVAPVVDAGNREGIEAERIRDDGNWQTRRAYMHLRNAVRGFPSLNKEPPSPQAGGIEGGSGS